MSATCGGFAKALVYRREKPSTLRHLVKRRKFGEDVQRLQLTCLPPLALVRAVGRALAIPPQIERRRRPAYMMAARLERIKWESIVR